MKTIELIKDSFSSWRPNSVKRSEKTKAVHRPTLKEDKLVAVNGTSERPIIMAMVEGAPNGTREYYVQDLLTSILGAGKSSPLYEKYVLGKKPVLTKADLFVHALKHSGAVAFSGELATDGNLDEFKSKFKKDLRVFCDRAINTRSITKVKNQFNLSLFEGFQTNESLAHFLGGVETFQDDFRKYKELINAYKNIKEKELRLECVSLFEKKPMLILSLWKEHKE